MSTCEQETWILPALADKAVAPQEWTALPRASAAQDRVELLLAHGLEGDSVEPVRHALGHLVHAEDPAGARTIILQVCIRKLEKFVQAEGRVWAQGVGAGVAAEVGPLPAGLGGKLLHAVAVLLGDVQQCHALGGELPIGLGGAQLALLPPEEARALVEVSIVHATYLRLFSPGTSVMPCVSDASLALVRVIADDKAAGRAVGGAAGTLEYQLLSLEP
eukprot:CAMPEP_0197896374 /NCGR_PEP_ID=MMETSP1439-20131203/39726_1 /TAXON_ID=66791 /ORGANISM="Gonyaulax spinifera, Strain CCMP409" /LENGTH=217 /DNA_ID=CAMNT_0043516893 /DNA_START=51 /DNA_END=704 /DNA_ORIENTATION=+